MTVSEDKKYLVLSLHQGESFENLNPSKTRTSADKPIPYRRETFKFREVLINFDTGFSMEDESVLGSRADGKNINDLVQFIDSVQARQDSINWHNSRNMRRSTYTNVFKLSNHYATSTAESDSLLADGFDAYFKHLPLEKKISAVQRAQGKSRQVASEYTFNQRQQEDTYTQLRVYRMQLQTKFALSLSCLLFFFIGAPLGAIIRKGGLGMPTVLSVFIYLAYYTINDFGTKMARTGIWDIWFGVWISTFVLTGMGIFFTYKASNDSAMFNLDGWKTRFKKLHRKIKKSFLSQQK